MADQEQRDQRAQVAREALHVFLRASLAQYTTAPVQCDVPLGADLGTADLLLTFPMGWRLVHQVRSTPCSILALAERTDAYARAGIDVLWWLCDAADDLDHHAWQLEHCGAIYFIGWAGRLPLPGTVHRTTDGWLRAAVTPGRSSEASTTGVERVVLTQWRELALVRYFELWDAVSTLRLLRALRGTATMGHSFGGMISGLKQQHLVRRVRGSAGLWRPAALERIYPHVPRWPAEGISAARERAWHAPPRSQ